MSREIRNSIFNLPEGSVLSQSNWIPLTLADPYNDVIKITALANSEFKFDINNSILYKESEVYAKIDSVIKLNPNEDKLSIIFRWIVDNYDIAFPLALGSLVEASILARFNSCPSGNCGGLSATAYRILKHYYPSTSHIAQLSNHVINYTDAASLDFGYLVSMYKGYYNHASIEEIKADVDLVTEPLRERTSHILYAGTVADYAALLAGYSHSAVEEAFVDGFEAEMTNADNLTMKLPKDGTFIFPVKTANAPARVGGDMPNWGNGLISLATGKTGVVSMPFILLQVTGTGTVKIDGITYTLPADNAALKTLLQGYMKYYNSFEVLTNTGGISAEYMVNSSRILLYTNNVYKKGIISGDITIESVATNAPVPTFILNINKGDADSWTINYDQLKVNTGQIKIPICVALKIYRCTFNKSGSVRPEPIQFLNTTANSTSNITAGTSVIDQCFAARLDPRDISFSDSLELTFTVYDESSCYYTLDGSTPDTTKTLYTAPFTITGSKTIKWINIKTGYANSHVNSRTISKASPYGDELMPAVSVWAASGLAWWNVWVNGTMTGDGTKINSNGTGDLIRGFTWTAGKTYKITVSATVTSGAFRIEDNTQSAEYISTSGTFDRTITVGSVNGYLHIYMEAFNGTITALSIKEIL